MEDPIRGLIHFKGTAFVIAFARDDRGAQPGREFIQALDDDQSTKVQAIIELLANSRDGIHNREKFKQLEPDLFGIKAARQVRIALFRRGQVWWLLTGHIKKQDQWRPAEIDRAKRLRDTHLAWLNSAGASRETRRT